MKRFKKLLADKRPDMLRGIFGSESGIVQPPLGIFTGRSKSNNTNTKSPAETEISSQEAHEEFKKFAAQTDVPVIAQLDRSTLLEKHADLSDTSGGATPISELERPPFSIKQGGKGQAHDPLEDTLYLGIGTGTESPIEPGTFGVVSESPGAAEMNVYEKAYQEEVDRILKNKEQVPQSQSSPKLYLTRRVDHIKQLRDNEHFADSMKRVNVGFSKLVDQARHNVETARSGMSSQKDGPSAVDLKAIVDQVKDNPEPVKEAPSEENVDTSSSKFSLKKLVGSAREKFEAATTKTPKVEAE